MKKLAALMVILLASACGSTQAARDAADDVPTPPPPGPTVDQRLTDMQTSMTEMLERLDVLSDRIARMETDGVGQAPSPVASAVQAPPSGQARAPVPTQEPQPPPPAEPKVSRAIIGAQIADDYRSALMLYGRGKLVESRKAFQQVYDSDPSGELADNALYWIGETWFAAGDYPTAIKFFRRVTTDYGDQNKAPDAAYKAGVAFEKSGDLQLAKQAFDECIKRYPYSTSAASAKQALERIKF
jgi:tol-pal system protein YbgF